MKIRMVMSQSKYTWAKGYTFACSSVGGWVTDHSKTEESTRVFGNRGILGMGISQIVEASMAILLARNRGRDEVWGPGEMRQQSS